MNTYFGVDSTEYDAWTRDIAPLAKAWDADSLKGTAITQGSSAFKIGMDRDPGDEFNYYNDIVTADIVSWTFLE